VQDDGVAARTAALADVCRCGDRRGVVRTGSGGGGHPSPQHPPAFIPSPNGGTRDGADGLHHLGGDASFSSGRTRAAGINHGGTWERRHILGHGIRAVRPRCKGSLPSPFPGGGGFCRFSGRGRLLARVGFQIFARAAPDTLLNQCPNLRRAIRGPGHPEGAASTRYRDPARRILAANRILDRRSRTDWVRSGDGFEAVGDGWVSLTPLHLT